MPPSFPSVFTQWSGDNVDHNMVTLDGIGNFHGMGCVSMSITLNRLPLGPCYESPVTRVPRRRVNELVFNAGIPFVQYSPPEVSSLSLLHFAPNKTLQFPFILPASMNLELA